MKIEIIDWIKYQNEDYFLLENGEFVKIVYDNCGTIHKKEIPCYFIDIKSNIKSKIINKLRDDLNE